jgi:hypothetical protein
MLAQSLKLIEAWGFTYASYYVWTKPGLGHSYWSRQDRAELLLVAKRGRSAVPQLGRRGLPTAPALSRCTAEGGGAP